MNGTRSLVLVCMLVLIAAAGCATISGNQDPLNPGWSVEESTRRLIGKWTLTDLGSTHIESILATPGVLRAPSLDIADDGKVSGFAGVNHFFADLDLARASGFNFPLGPVGATKMAGPPEAMAIEHEYLSALSSATRYDARRLRDGVLILLDMNGGKLMRFVRAVGE